MLFLVSFHVLVKKGGIGGVLFVCKKERAAAGKRERGEESVSVRLPPLIDVMRSWILLQGCGINVSAFDPTPLVIHFFMVSVGMDVFYPGFWPDCIKYMHLFSFGEIIDCLL